MRVRMMVGLSGPTVSLQPGDEADIEKGEAERLIAAGFAAPIEKIERAVKRTAKVEKR